MTGDTSPSPVPDPSLGERLRRSAATRAAAALTAAAVVGIDLLLAHHHMAIPAYRLPLALVAVAVCGALSAWQWRALGLRWRPAQGWGYWLRLGAKLGGVLVLFMVGGIAVRRANPGLELPFHEVRLFTSGWQFAPWAVRACLLAPVVEEAVYRLALCPPSAALLGERGAIVVSGCAFAALHVAYGNAAPDNVVAGFILGWAFLKSRSIVVPVVMHSLGNLLVGAYHLALLHFGL